MFALLKCWCVHGAKHICVGAVGVDNVLVVCVGVAGTWSAVPPIFFLIIVMLPHGALGMFDFLF